MLRGVRLVRLLQGARGRVRAAHLPVGLAQGAPPGGVPRRGAHPRPRHVPEAADPRRRPPVRHRGARRSTSTSPTTAYRVERVGRYDEPPPGILGEAPRPAAGMPASGLPDGRGYGIRLALADVKGITDAEIARIVAGRPYASLSDFWHGPGVPAGGRAAGRRRGLRLAVRHRVTGPGPAPGPGDPARPAAAGRRAGPLDPRRQPGRADRARPAPRTNLPRQRAGPRAGPAQRSCRRRGPAVAGRRVGPRHRPSS